MQGNAITKKPAIFLEAFFKEGTMIGVPLSSIGERNRRYPPLLPIKKLWVELEWQQVEIQRYQGLFFNVKLFDVARFLVSKKSSSGCILGIFLSMETLMTVMMVTLVTPTSKRLYVWINMSIYIYVYDIVVSAFWHVGTMFSSPTLEAMDRCLA